MEPAKKVLLAPQLLARPRPRRKERYRLLKLIGQGGTGAVYKAEDLELDRIIAIKLLHPMLAGDEKYVDLLRREVVVASQITHPNIVRIFDVSLLRKSPIITMAFIQGENLGALIHRDGALTTPRVLHFARQICAGLEEAHRCGIVHRDLKPQNLLIDQQSQLFISDFGLAHASNVAKHESIGSGDRPGTLQYMSPEQFHALPFDSRSDIFSFGLLLYEMLTGTALQVDHTAAGKIAVDKNTGKAAQLPRYSSKPLTAIALRCLAQDPAERYQTASEILACLPPGVFTSSAHEGIEPVSTHLALRGARRRAIILSGIGLVLLAGIGFWISGVFRKTSTSPSFDELYRKASAELRKSDNPQSLQRAAVLFRSAAALNPVRAAYEGSAAAELRLYQLGSDGRNLQDAKSAIEKAEQLDRSGRSTALLHAEIDIAEGEYAAGISRLNRILSSERASDDIVRLLAKAQFAAGDSSKALETWRTAVNLNPNYWVNHNGLGAALMKLGRPKEAEPEYRKVIELQPNSHVGYSNLGSAYIANGEFDKAIPVIEKALSIRPVAAEFNNLGTALYYTGSCHASLPLLERAVQLDSRAELYVGNLAEAYRCLGDPEKATATYAIALRLAQDKHQKAPNDARLTARLGVYLARLGNVDEGGRLVESALSASPSNPEIWYSKAQLCVLRDRFSEGAAAVEAALSNGYSIKEAARDPELRPLWVDSGLKSRFEAELNQPAKLASDRTTW